MRRFWRLIVVPLMFVSAAKAQEVTHEEVRAAFAQLEWDGWEPDDTNTDLAVHNTTSRNGDVITLSTRVPFILPFILNPLEWSMIETRSHLNCADYTLQLEMITYKRPGVEVDGGLFSGIGAAEPVPDADGRSKLDAFCADGRSWWERLLD